MNRRIQELAFKAGLGEHLWLDIADSDDVKVTEKFAELIVWECAETIQDFVDHRFPASEYPVRLSRWLSCNEFAMTQLHQPCEACPNRSAQGM